jgi:CRP-like cAMP-binding protein
MLSQRSFRPYQDPRSPPIGCSCAIATLRQNGLIAALPHAESQRLLPHLEPVPLLRGSILHRAGERETHLYFITSGVVSRFYMLEDGAQAGFALTGNEGVIGVGGFFGGEGAPTQAAVLCEGYACRIGVDALWRVFAHVPTLLPLLLRYTQALITQTTQTVVCNRFHSVEQQLCRSILSCLDRLPSDELVVTQDLLADLLGVRREAITAAAGTLQEAGLIQYRRGHIAVLERAALEARACECYGVVKREYERLLPAPHGEEPVYAGWNRAAQW